MSNPVHWTPQIEQLQSEIMAHVEEYGGDCDTCAAGYIAHGFASGLLAAGTSRAAEDAAIKLADAYVEYGRQVRRSTPGTHRAAEALRKAREEYEALAERTAPAADAPRDAAPATLPEVCRRFLRAWNALDVPGDEGDAALMEMARLVNFDGGPVELLPEIEIVRHVAAQPPAERSDDFKCTACGELCEFNLRCSPGEDLCWRCGARDLAALKADCARWADELSKGADCYEHADNCCVEWCSGCAAGVVAESYRAKVVAEMRKRAEGA